MVNIAAETRCTSCGAASSGGNASIRMRIAALKKPSTAAHTTTPSAGNTPMPMIAASETTPQTTSGQARRSSRPAQAATARWWPDWRDPLIWKLGIALGAANAMYFTANAFLPDYLHHLQRPDLVSAALTALNLGQIPASFLLLATAGRLERRAWPFVVCGVASLAAVVGIAVLPVGGVVVCAAVIGFFNAAILILMLALPPLLAPPQDVHRVSAAMFTISYSCAVITPIFSGLLWDLTGVAWSAFAPLGACALVMMALAPTVKFNSR